MFWRVSYSLRLTILSWASTEGSGGGLAASLMAWAAAEPIPMPAEGGESAAYASGLGGVMPLRGPEGVRVVHAPPAPPGGWKAGSSFLREEGVPLVLEGLAALGGERSRRDCKGRTGWGVEGSGGGGRACESGAQ